MSQNDNTKNQSIQKQTINAGVDIAKSQFDLFLHETESQPLPNFWHYCSNECSFLILAFLAFVSVRSGIFI